MKPNEPLNLEELLQLGCEKVYIDRTLRLRLTPNIWMYRRRNLLGANWELVPDPSYLEQRYHKVTTNC